MVHFDRISVHFAHLPNTNKKSPEGFNLQGFKSIAEAGFEPTTSRL
jgi:hypothetical protein